MEQRGSEVCEILLNPGLSLYVRRFWVAYPETEVLGVLEIFGCFYIGHEMWLATSIPKRIVVLRVHGCLCHKSATLVSAIRAYNCIARWSSACVSVLVVNCSG